MMDIRDAMSVETLAFNLGVLQRRTSGCVKAVCLLNHSSSGLCPPQDQHDVCCWEIATGDTVLTLSAYFLPPSAHSDSQSSALQNMHNIYQ